MRVGIKTTPLHTTWDAMLDVWRAADDIDVFESAWNFDHFSLIFSDSTGPNETTDPSGNLVELFQPAGRGARTVSRGRRTSGFAHLPLWGSSGS